MNSLALDQQLANVLPADCEVHMATVGWEHEEFFVNRQLTPEELRIVNYGVDVMPFRFSCSFCNNLYFLYTNRLQS